MSKSFYCECCKYSTKNKGDYERHMKCKKHEKNYRESKKEKEIDVLLLVEKMINLNKSLVEKNEWLMCKNEELICKIEENEERFKIMEKKFEIKERKMNNKFTKLESELRDKFKYSVFQLRTDENNNE